MGTDSSGSLRGGEGSTLGQGCPGAGSFSMATRVDSASLMFSPSNLSCRSDRWAGRAVLRG